MNKGIVLPLYRGPFQSNGATPWYCELGIGTPAQPLKICFDTGASFNWITSSLCAEDSCKHYADARFNIAKSSSFEWISQQRESVAFGPWGTVSVESGRDKLWLSLAETSNVLPSDFYLTQEYSGTQFEELDWDGGIGLPSGMQSDIATQPDQSQSFKQHSCADANQPSTNFFMQLIQVGLVSADMPYMTFVTDAKSKKQAHGSVGFGVLDTSYASSLEYVYMSWCCYQKEASYLWSTSGAKVCVDGTRIASDLFFTLDSGSSQFKGDNAILTQLFNLTCDHDPVVSISLHNSAGEEYAVFEIPSDIYRCEIEEGEKKGECLSQFQGLAGADAMLLVGSVMMDHLYTVYEYDLSSEEEIHPKGVWVFNKPDGPKIIKTQQTHPARLFNR